MLAWACVSFVRYESATRAGRLCLTATRDARLNLQITRKYPASGPRAVRQIVMELITLMRPLELGSS